MADATVYEQVAQLTKIDRRSARLAEVAYQAVKDAILSGILRPEFPLVEERLAEVLSISRTPVREALTILVHEGLLESIPHKGLFVRAIRLDDFIQMFEASEVLEVAIAREASRLITANDVMALQKFLDKAELCVPRDIPGHFSACRAFLQRLGECSGNPYLTKFLMTIEESSDLYLITNWELLPADKLLQGVEDRRAILNAVRIGDAEAAAQAAHRHTRSIRQRWRDILVQT